MTEKINIPKHVAIIMDGNGRWAKKRNLPRTAGHRKGVEVVEKIIRAADDLGIKVLSLYAFSTENWLRPKTEINMLLRTLIIFVKINLERIIKNNIKIVIMGDIDRFSKDVRQILLEIQEKTKDNAGLIVNLALNYGSRIEIVEAVKKVAIQIAEGKINLENLDEDKFSQFLYTKDLPDPDLLIRTSGEMRISNFMLWQLSYAEFYFSNKFWPDFTKEDLKEAISEYQRRERRFGGIDAFRADN